MAYDSVRATPSPFGLSVYVSACQSAPFSVSLDVMRVAIVIFCALDFAAPAWGLSEPIDVSNEPTASLHRYVGCLVMVTGRISLHSSLGTFVETGKARIYITPRASSVCDPALDGKRLIVVGTLRYEHPPAIARMPSFLYFDRDCTIHYFPPGPARSRQTSNQPMQPTAERPYPPLSLSL
jgi:hypothetical protein